MPIVKMYYRISACRQNCSTYLFRFSSESEPTHFRKYLQSNKIEKDWRDRSVSRYGTISQILSVGVEKIAGGPVSRMSGQCYFFHGCMVFPFAYRCATARISDSVSIALIVRMGMFMSLARVPCANAWSC